MTDFYSPKTILITGAASGIGGGLARYLAGFGARLVLSDLHREGLEQTAKDCTDAGAEVLTFPADVCDAKRMTAIRDEVLAQWGFVDIVIANAGVGGLNPGDAFSPEINRKMMEINFFGMVNTLTPFIPSMLDKRRGQLVGVSSMAAFRGLPNAASYSTSKRAQAIFLESMRVDLRKHNIAVTSIHPGFVKTPMVDHDQFDMPFTVPVEKSSALIARAVQRRKSVYLYPWPMKLITWLNRLLPNFIYDRLVPRVTGQKSGVKPQIF